MAPSRGRGGRAAAWWLLVAVLGRFAACGLAEEEEEDLSTVAASGAEGRRLEYIDIIWDPPIVVNPPGGGGPTLFAGANYTSWQLLGGDRPALPFGRLLIVSPIMHYSGAPAGHCQSPLYNVLDKVPPLDGQVPIPAVGRIPTYTGGIMFPQGGIYKLCWSRNGTFGIGDGEVVPKDLSQYRIYGATDGCQQGAGCLAARRFFCHLPHAIYAIYGPLGTGCTVFMNATTSPLVYSRLTWVENATTDEFAEAELEAAYSGTPLRTVGGECPGLYVGPGLLESDGEWIREVDPLARIDLGRTRINLTQGFHYRLCFCPSFDASDDGVCGQLSDFVQQVGYLDGIMITYLGVLGDVADSLRAQVVPMTRFTVRVDCGNGPWCGNNSFPRIKVIAKSWDPVETTTDLPFWHPLNACPGAAEVSAWHSPPNCINTTSRKKSAGGCMFDGGSDLSIKLFKNVRMLPKLESNAPVAQIFDVCFVHLPLEVDGLQNTKYDPTSSDALQNTTRLFWKVGQLVVEPLVVYRPYSYVINRDVEVRVGPLDLSRTTTLHDSFPELVANGTAPHGPILKVVESAVDVPTDNAWCAFMRPQNRDVVGVDCRTAATCTPRATKVGEELVLNGGDPDHRINIKRTGSFAICYCEKWDGEPNACADATHWVLVGKVLVAGPLGTQEWILDIGIIQSFVIEGYGFSDEFTLRDGALGPMNTIRVLQAGESDCQGRRNRNLAFDALKVCSPRNEGRCQGHSVNDSIGLYDTNIKDIPGTIWRYNSTDPSAYITQLVPQPGYTTVVFSEVAVLSKGDTIHFEDNIDANASHWRRRQDLQRIVRGMNVGHQLLDITDAGRQALIPLTLAPFPPIIITPPQQGRWWRSNKLRIPDIKGTKETQPMLVCWGLKSTEEEESTYWTYAGYISFAPPSALSTVDMGLTTTAAGAIAPVMITFVTGDNPKYREATNSMQLRVTFTNTSILAPAESGVNARPLQHLYDADQAHEASQAVCGRLFNELWSEQEFGFPVPQGCWIDFNRYGSKGRVKAIYMIFEPLNGLKSMTSYTLVMNMQLMQVMPNYTDITEDPGLIEIAALDDIIVKPEGIVDIGWANPDKPVEEPARTFPYPDANFADDSNLRGGITVRQYARDTILFDKTPASTDNFVRVQGNTFGMAFLIKGKQNNPITARTWVRLYFWPLTAWNFNYLNNCEAECVPQFGYSCNFGMLCSYEAAQSVCRDKIPPGVGIWVDSRGRDCNYYQKPTACELDAYAYRPHNGMSALEACCICNGGVRYNANIVKLRMPLNMDPARGSTVIHTIRFWRAAPVPARGFFATRIGAQLTSLIDDRPHYIVTSGKYIIKAANASLYSPVATLVAAEGWGNSRQFKNEPLLNDFYMRLQWPITMYGTPWRGTGYLTRLDIFMPQGFRCVQVLRADPVGLDDDLVALPVLPKESPTGNGEVSPSDSYAGGNRTTPGTGYRAGRWDFQANKCTFAFEPYMTMYQNSRVYLHIFALNPPIPLPRNDPTNYWVINLTSSGDSGVPLNYVSAICEPYRPPTCLDTGETKYVNPVGDPPEARSLDLLYPNESDVSLTMGPINLGLPPNLTTEPNYTINFAVLGILDNLVVQPKLFHLAARNTLQIWFAPDMGNTLRGGYLGIQTPTGFVFDNPCVARDLAYPYYALYSPPFGQSGLSPWVNTPAWSEVQPRVWPLENMGLCFPFPSPSWSPGGNYVRVRVDGSLLPGRRYGLEIDVTNPSTYDWSKGFRLQDKWAFKLDITDAAGFGRDGTYTTGSLFPNGTQAPTLYRTFLAAPILVRIDEMQPYVFRPLTSRVEVSPIILAQDIYGFLRVTAPEGYEWSVSSQSDYAPVLNGSTLFPGGLPSVYPDPYGRKNALVWPKNASYQAGRLYAFATYAKVPVIPPRASANAFFFEWGYNDSGTGRALGAYSPAPQVRTLRGARFELSSTVQGSLARAWLWFETLTNITVNGTLEVQLPAVYQAMAFRNTTLVDGGRYIDVLAVLEYGSQAVPADFLCRQVAYPSGVTRLVFFANRSGIASGRYVLEFNVTNPAQASSNALQSSSACGRVSCLSIYSKEACGSSATSRACPAVIPVPQLAPATGQWSTTQPAVKSPQWRWENDYWTTIPTLPVTNQMALGAILNLTLDERLGAGRDDRPLRRSALVFAMTLSQYKPVDGDELRIRAPVGWLFDAACDFFTRVADVLPPAGVTSYKIGTTRYQVDAWPSSARVLSCQGDAHNAVVKLAAGLLPGKFYLFRVGIKSNPQATPFRRNTWSLTLGAESSGEIPGFQVATFPGAVLDPIFYAWTYKWAPLGTPIGFRFNVTNSLYTVTMNDRRLLPMIRIIMPPLYEVVVGGDNQDIQGGACFVVIQIDGVCRECGIPFKTDTYTCQREWNRKNVAQITLLKDAAFMYVGLTYKLWVVVYNPAIESARDAPPPTWIVETFLGNPVPPATAPDGYWLDYTAVTGFKISNKANLTVQVPMERNGSAEVPPQHFSMRFPEPLVPGDSVELIAPPGFSFTRVTKDATGYSDIVVCRQLVWLEVTWPTEEEALADKSLVRPPPRPPTPPSRPPWAPMTAWTEALPLRPNASGNATTNRTNCSNVSSGSNSVNCTNQTLLNATEEFLLRGLPEWALPAALAAQAEAAANASQNGSNSFLVLREHCLQNWSSATVEWTDLPEDAALFVDVQAVYVNESGSPNVSDFTLTFLMCVRAEVINHTALAEREAAAQRCRQNCSCTGGDSANCSSNQSACLAACQYATPTVTLERCSVITADQMPPNSTAVAVRVSDIESCNETCCDATPLPDTASGLALPPGADGCSCWDEKTLLVQVLWQASSDLTPELDRWQKAYQDAIDLLEWDRFPFRPTPDCSGNKVTFNLRKKELHPDIWLLNGTTIPFMLGYQNPTRPPLWFLNFWAVRHFQSAEVVSSDALAGWPVVSLLRYMRAELLNEVLKPEDPADIHFEFVTVNPADKLDIYAISPQTFGFSNAFISSSPNETSITKAAAAAAARGRRMYWQGFTDVQMGAKTDTQMSILMSVDVVEYVRFDVGGILLPWQGGQALFSFFSSISDLSQDELQNCCPPGYPPTNPGVVFQVPYRLANLRGSLSNEFMLNRAVYPIASAMENRLKEQQLVAFTFMLPKSFTASKGDEIILVVRTPMAYAFVPTTVFEVRITATATRLSTRIRQLNVSRVEIGLPGLGMMVEGEEYKISFQAITPPTHKSRADRRIWVFEVTQNSALDAGTASQNLGAYDDFDLYAQVNFTVFAARSPPQVVVEVDVTFFNFGELPPNQVDVIAPSGYTFLLNCLVPEDKDLLRSFFVSCRERWSLWNGNYLSGASLMTVDGGILSNRLPVTVKLLVGTPAQTPVTNSWYVRVSNRFGPLGWGLLMTGFPVRPMDVDVQYAASAGGRVPLFLAIRARYPFPYGGFIHLAAPRFYQLFCPVTKVLRGPSVPICSQTDPLLTGCWGLPSVDDPNPPPGLPLCDPLHELLLTFPKPVPAASNQTTTAAPTGSAYVLNPGDSLLLSLEVRVPVSTPTPRTENVFQVTLLDESKLTLDGKLDIFGGEVVEEPRVDDFNLWWTRALPNAIVSVAVQFTFNHTVIRSTEDPARRLRVIQIQAPTGLRLAVRRPKDVVNLEPASPLAVTVWNWTGLMPTGLWFGLDETKNVSGMFHYAFPVLLPAEGGFPYNNLWQVKFCADSPFCSTQLIAVPMPGFFFGDEPAKPLSAEALERLMGGWASRQAAPWFWSWSCLLFGILVCYPHGPPKW